MKKLLRIFALCLGLIGGQSAHAGIPVIDVANLAEAIQQTLAWAEQYGQMEQEITTLTSQLNQLQTSYNSIQGVRGMGSLVNNPALRKYLPDDWNSTMNLVGTASSGSYGSLSTSIDAIKSAANIMDIGDSGLNTTSAPAKLFTGSKNQAAVNRAVGEAGMQQASARFDSIQTLLDKVNDAPDDKDVQDLQARISAEQAMIQNEAVKTAYLQQLQQAQRDLAYQQAREISMQATKGAIPRF